MKIVRLSAKNFLNLSAVEITIDGNLVKITGKNGAGKSNALDIVSVVLGGLRLCPKEPIKRGETEGFAQVDMGEYIATRTFKLRKGGGLVSEVRLEGKEGATYRSPQAMIDKIIGDLAFDPLKFYLTAKENPRKARDMLLGSVDLGIDLDELAEARKDAYDERGRVNKEIKNKQGALAEMVEPGADLPAEEVSLAELTREHQAAVETKTENSHKREALEDKRCGALSLESEIQMLKGELLAHQEKLNRLVFERDQLSAEAGALQDPDLDAISQKIEEAEETNQQIRATKAQREKRKVLKMDIGELTKEYLIFTHEIESLDAQKQAALKRANFPIDGLTVDENGVRYKDLPFGQASTSDGIRVGMAVAMAKSPNLRAICIYEGGLLDSQNMAIIEEMAKGEDFVVLVEVVDETGKLGVVIEDGRVIN